MVQVGDQLLEKTVEPTGDWYAYKSFDLGVVNLPRKGPLRVIIRPAQAAGQNLMYFESLSLEPETVAGRLGRVD